MEAGLSSTAENVLISCDVTLTRSNVSWQVWKTLAVLCLAWWRGGATVNLRVIQVPNASVVTEKDGVMTIKDPMLSITVTAR